MYVTKKNAKNGKKNEKKLPLFEAAYEHVFQKNAIFVKKWKILIFFAGAQKNRCTEAHLFDLIIADDINFQEWGDYHQ